MKKSLVFSFLLLIFLLFTLSMITCKKEYSYEGGRVAAYNFVGSPDTCTNAFVRGNYYKGIAAIDSVNTVTVNINVTSPGLANITTDVVDGIYFSSGDVNLIDINSGVLSLSGYGTPTAAGTFTFHIPGTTGCSFTITVTNQPGAEYTLSGSPNDCSNPVMQGTYKQGIAMTSANVVTINLDVIKPGNYQITTDMENGISFSGSGTFTTTGAQQVVLQAAGTPDIPELTRLLLNAGAEQCSFYVSVANSDPVATYVLQSGMQNGIDYCTPGSVQGGYVTGTPLTAGNTLTVNAYVTVPGNFTISTTEQAGMKFSFTGTFTAIGAQDVVLKGSGTPTASGTFTFTPQIVGPAPIGGSICGLDVLVQ